MGQSADRSPLPLGHPPEPSHNLSEKSDMQRRLTPTTAPNGSFETGTGPESIGYDSPPVTSQTLSNPQVDTGEDNSYPGAPDLGRHRLETEGPDAKHDR